MFPEFILNPKIKLPSSVVILQFRKSKWHHSITLPAELQQRTTYLNVGNSDLYLLDVYFICDLQRIKMYASFFLL